MSPFNLQEVPRSPTLTRFSRGIGNTKWKMMLLGISAFLLAIFLLGFRTQDQLIGIVHSASKTDKTSTSLSIGNAKTELAAQAGDKGPVLGDGERMLSKKSLADLRNETLGVEKIYVLNMPGRSDKLDAMRLTSSLTGFRFDVLEAIDGADVPAGALSTEWPKGPLSNGQIGCWRGHMNFASKIVENRLASALIIEDDADWDVAFRSQLEYFALGSQTLLETPMDTAPHSPYGDGWDLIWLGHCASQPVDNDHRRFVIKNDPTTTPPNHRVNFGGVPDMTPYDNTTRIVYYSKGSTCTYAYALSYRGAQKVLKYLSMDIFNKPIDFGLHDMCEMDARGFKCLGVFPQLIGEHKPAGGANKDSDIGEGGTEVKRKQGFSYNVVHSTRLNVEALIDGKLDQVESQWPDETSFLSGPITTEFQKDLVQNKSDPGDNSPD